MQTIKFKTNLKCNGCVNAIKPYMDSIQGIESWNANLDDANKTVEVNLKDDVNENIINEILNGFKQAGYSAEKL